YELYHFYEALGISGSVVKTFETATVSYYLFVFKEHNEYLHYILIDSLLDVKSYSKVRYDLRYPE
ncbi:hypothetical protein KKA00_12950, partial [bacterium]|nr:hypothetical protein [bacterium]